MTDLPTFGEFFRALNRPSIGSDTFDPYPWQRNLVSRVADRGWPERIVVPTGLGKTCLLDIATYVAAVRGFGPESPARRRICFVIDRRVVVDEAHRRAERIRDFLAEGDRDGPWTPHDRAIAAEIRRALSSHGAYGIDAGVVATRMRGGTTWSWNWLDRPDRMAIVTGTVDQLGSRFLFRGYGLGHLLTPIDAALVGNDSLIIVDEAHLAEPLVTTLTSALALDKPELNLPLATPTVITMSATLPNDQSGRNDLRIGPDDRKHSVAGPRLRKRKLLNLVQASKGRVAEAISLVARELAGHGSVIGVVCNTVGRAREVFDLLAGQEVERVLLTGRVRSLDRDTNMDEYRHRFLSGWRERAPQRTLIVVSTQTIEVGVDADFDHLVTEACPWASLVQRLGRLDRAAAARHTAQAVVVTDEGDDFVYGPSSLATWAWLKTKVHPVSVRRKVELRVDGLNVSVDSVLDLNREASQLVDLAPVQTRVPAIGLPHIDAWAQTAPRPSTDPPIDVYLHGSSDQRPQVRFVWRADLGTSKNAALESVARTPVLAAEVLELPLLAARSWLRRHTSPVSDHDAWAATTSTSSTRGVTAPEPRGRGWSVALRSSGEPIAVPIPELVDKIRADDTIVLPVGLGGCDRWGWAPGSDAVVSDLADLAGISRIRERGLGRVGSVRLRLLEGVGGLVRSPEPDGPDLVSQCEAALLAEANDEAYQMIQQLFPDIVGLAATPAGRPLRIANPPHWVVVLGVGGVADPTAADSDSMSDPAASSRSLARVPLSDHAAAVAARAREICECLGLDDEVSRTVVMAAEWHDVGKLDGRFQAMLQGGELDPFLGLGESLAKSGMDPADRQVFRRARRASGLPLGFRHEAGSAQAASQQATALGLGDPELFVHLVAAHHGYSRPLLPPVTDPEPLVLDYSWNEATFRMDRGAPVDWSQPARFQALNRRYGRWRLAMLESIVRLSDIGCSREGS